MTARRSLTKIGRAPGRAEVMPTLTLEPLAYRPPRHDDDEDEKEIEEAGIRINRLLVVMWASYAIQKRCGLFPLTKSEEDQLQCNEKMIREPPEKSPERDAHLIAGERLVERVACTHCMARSECIRGRA